MDFVHRYNRKLLQREFERWLEEPVALQNCDLMTREYSIHLFIQDLREFIESKGYAFRVDEKELAKAWARYRFKLYFGLYDGKQIFYKPCPNSHEEDLTMFQDKFDAFVWNKYLENIATWPDFGYDRPDNKKAMFNILNFIWYYIDIDNSKMTAKVDDMFVNSDEDENAGENEWAKAKEDPYLRDQTEHHS
jgi:hypothetical protein